MSTAAPIAEAPALPRWRDVVWPKEHGSWSLALEPVALGLLAAPSLGGVALAVAIAAGFFARRPLRIAFRDARVERRIAARRAVTVCGLVAMSGVFLAVLTAGFAWWPWLLPTLLGGAVFLSFDLQQAGREQQAEVAGALAFAWIPAVLGALAAMPAGSAAALGCVMLARAVPTVLTVRATVRARKGQPISTVVPLSAAVLAALGIALLAKASLAPWTAAVAVAVLAIRSFVLLVTPRPALRASTIGMIETAIGVAFVVAVAAAW